MIGVNMNIIDKFFCILVVLNYQYTWAGGESRKIQGPSGVSLGEENLSSDT